MPWLTPDDEIGTVYRTLAIPVPFLSQVSGALIKLAEAWNWEEYGDMSVQDCVDAMSGMIDTYYEGNVMIGLVVPYAGDTANLPDNVLLCDGAVYDRVDYPALYAVLADAYLDDADTFHTPQLVDTFVVGTDENEGAEGGEATHTLTADEMPSHLHEYQEKNEILFPYGTLTPDISARGTLLESARETSSAGGGEAHNNLPPYHAMTYVIVAR